MFFEDTETPLHYTGPPTSRSYTLVGALELPQTPSNPQDNVNVETDAINDFGATEPLQIAINPENSEDGGINILDAVVGPTEPPQMESSSQDYVDTGASVSHGSVGANELPPVESNQPAQCRFRDCLLCQSCGYGRDGRVCREDITCSTVPQHFRAVHGIRCQGRDVKIICQWENCRRSVLRHSFIRHICKFHLGHGKVHGHN